MAEIDDNQLKELLAAHKLLGMLHGNKDTKRDFERLAKKVNPQAVTTDDIAEPYVAEVRKEVEDLKAWKSGMEKNIQDYNDSQAFGRLREAGYTQDGLDAIKKIMEEKKVNDPEVAAAYWDKTRPTQPVAPNGLSPSLWNFNSDLADTEEMNKLLWQGDGDEFIDRVAADIYGGKRN